MSAYGPMLQLRLAAAVTALVAGLAGAADVTVAPRWSAPLRNVTTAATVEVDHMPFLSRTNEGGPYWAYASALRQLGAAYVRFAPWYPYPRVAIAEMTPANCSGAGSSWNSSLLDVVVADFMEAVCGPDAAKGACVEGRSVVPQLSTIPDYMLLNGSGVLPPGSIPEDPWQYKSGDKSYYIRPLRHRPLRDPTCRELARYAARIVGWYTAGGMVDECGVRHHSGLYYKWPLVSVLNEDEYMTPPEGGVQYTICWDAWREEIAKVNPAVRLVGPEMGGSPPGGGGQLAYNLYFLNGSHHADGNPPPVISNHVAFGGQQRRAWFTGIDEWIQNTAEPLEAARVQMAPDTEAVMNEFIPFIDDWCAQSASGGCCPDWQQISAKGTAINRRTLSWNAAAASFAYGFGRLAALGYKYVGADQLIGGPWPDNEPAVSCLDWQTGEPNAKYWAIRMLADAFGSDQKTLHDVSVTRLAPRYPAGTVANGTCGSTGFGGDCAAGNSGAWNASLHGVRTLEDCVALCHGCPRCRYVSFTPDPQHDDCSWYNVCDFGELRNAGATPPYQSEAVRPDVADPGLYALPFSRRGRRSVLLVSQRADTVTVSVDGAAGVAAEVLHGLGSAEPGFVPTGSTLLGADGTVTLGGYGVAVVSLD
eukprot:TRINITY_DN10188_c0_g1_i1.p1 TRINITY_DN10188_c0_g1~~TRINITY_DN10188_c0_g1_i1.p1  ORF type:complete len:646 (+),score=94.18 TRINITY_DN10188_c0_g1_i1:65-2002(+)